MALSASVVTISCEYGSLRRRGAPDVSGVPTVFSLLTIFAAVSAGLPGRISDDCFLLLSELRLRFGGASPLKSGVKGTFAELLNGEFI